MQSLGTLKYSGIKLDDVVAVQRAIIRVERAITDEILFVADARDVVPMRSAKSKHLQFFEPGALSPVLWEATASI